MNKRHWLKPTSFGLVVVVATMWGLGWWSGSNYEGQWDAGPKPAPYPVGDVPSAETFWAGKIASSAVYEQVCAYPIDKDQADLCQQWNSAQAAKQVAWYTLVSVGIGIAGLLGLWNTVRYAKEAARHARDGVLETRRIGEAQVRAYITVDTYSLEPSSPVPIARVVIKNTGQSPAKSVRFNFGFYTGDAPTPPLLKIDQDEPASVRDIGSGGEYPITQAWNSFVGTYRHSIMVDRTRTGWLHGVVEYQDVFGVDRTTWFTFGIVPSDTITAAGEPNLSVYIAPHGNQST